MSQLTNPVDWLIDFLSEINFTRDRENQATKDDDIDENEQRNHEPVLITEIERTLIHCAS
jgi:hypothetical protein